MTQTEAGVETLAERIAVHGREALVERLRAAYAGAAAAHADLVSLDSGRIEAMVQAAADRADGLQWRRALAGVAAEELGISVSDALAHPAVAQAQELLGAPSYEQSLADLIAHPVPAAGAVSAAPAVSLAGPAPAVAPAAPMFAPAAPGVAPGAVENGFDAAAQRHAPAPVTDVSVSPSSLPVADAALQSPSAAGDALEAVEADDVVLELLPEPDPTDFETQLYDVPASFQDEDVAPVREHFAPLALDADAFGGGEAPAHAGQFDAGGQFDDGSRVDAGGQFDDGSRVDAGGQFDADGQFDAGGAGLLESPEQIASPDNELVFPAIHLGGVANLPTKREGLSIRLSEDGLDIVGEQDIIGRLMWDEIEMLEVPSLRARRRRTEPRARLVVRTPHGDASFEVPGRSADELRGAVEPLAEMYGRNG